MENYNFLISVAIIILSTKFLGGISEKVNMPQVVGALVAGVILGPSVLGFVTETDFISMTSEIGVILLMFMAGLDTDMDEIKQNSVSLLVIAGFGVIVPLIGGFVAYYYYFNVDSSDFNQILQAVFMGVILTATSVSITVEALREMGKLNGRVGSAILGAAVIDDIIGIIILTIVTSLKDSSVSIIFILFKVIGYCILMAIIAFGIKKMSSFIDLIKDKRRVSIYVFASCMIIAYVSEEFFGIADITGAYLLGLFLSKLEVKPDIAKKMTVPAYLFFSPIFFASIGIKTEISGMTTNLLIFSLLILVIAILSKVIGCSIGARLCKYTPSESFHIGIGMISRGEVALIVAQKGYNLGLLHSALFSPVVLVVIVTTMVTPILLKKFMK
ncbi:MAG: cation:proton antiporter [Anaerovoracaceae bacterium]